MPSPQRAILRTLSILLCVAWLGACGEAVLGRDGPGDEQAAPAGDDNSSAVNDDDSSAAVDDTSSSGDDTSSGDDSSAAGDDTSSSGDDTSSSGDDTSSSGDDTSSSGDDTTSTGDDTSSSGDDNANVEPQITLSSAVWDDEATPPKLTIVAALKGAPGAKMELAYEARDGAQDLSDHFTSKPSSVTLDSKGRGKIVAIWSHETIPARLDFSITVTHDTRTVALSFTQGDEGATTAVQVGINDLPVINAFDICVPAAGDACLQPMQGEGQAEVLLEVRASDANQDEIHYDWTVSPAGCGTLTERYQTSASLFLDLSQVRTCTVTVYVWDEHLEVFDDDLDDHAYPEQYPRASGTLTVIAAP